MWWWICAWALHRSVNGWPLSSHPTISGWSGCRSGSAGFVTLSPVADVHYRCSSYHAAAAERVMAWDDPDVAIDWPIADPILSARDRRGMSLKEYLKAPAPRRNPATATGRKFRRGSGGRSCTRWHR